MKTNQLIVGLALGLGLLMVFGFQNRGNEDGDGEVMMIHAYAGTSVVSPFLCIIFPDGTSRVEKLPKAKPSSVSYSFENSDKAATIAMNKYRKEGFSVKTAVIDPGGYQTFVLER